MDKKGKRTIRQKDKNTKKTKSQRDKFIMSREQVENEQNVLCQLQYH